MFVDGRYTLQAKIQSGKLFTVYTLPKKIPSLILKNKKFNIGFDPKLHTQRNIDYFFHKTKSNLIPIKDNLIDKIWRNKKKLNYKKFFTLSKTVTGKSYTGKINSLLKILKKRKIDLHFISSSENIAWLLNIRGSDCDFSPLANAYLTISSNKKINFFCNIKKIDKAFKKKFKQITFIDIKYLDLTLSKISNKKVLIDSSSCSIHYEKVLKKYNKILNIIDPLYNLKSIKSKTELKNTIKSHVFDGAALTKFLFLFKKNYKKKNLDEIRA